MIEQLWQEHNSKPFPEGQGGREVEGIDLALLDGAIAGCISTFLERGGELDLWRTAVLGLCYHDVAVVRKHLRGDARDHFVRLESISKLVLKSVITKHKGSA
jgi:hypothetical protein